MRLLVVEDDHQLVRALRSALQDSGLIVDTASTVSTAMDHLLTGHYDVVLLDRRLPDGDGIDLCGWMRAQGMTAYIIMLTAASAIADRVDGLDAGADDYLVKPCPFDELLAHVRAFLRRSPDRPLRSWTVGDITINPATRSVTRSGIELALTPKEFALLRVLVAEGGATVTKTELLDRVWSVHGDGSPNVVEVHIKNLRRKLDEPSLIETVAGGYRIACDYFEPVEPAPRGHVLEAAAKR
jgi:DNA-binding response OmpR family regulator